MQYQKNIIIAVIALLLVGGVWMIGSSGPKPVAFPDPQDIPNDAPATSTDDVPFAEEPVEPAPSPEPAPARIELFGQTEFLYDITVGESKCGELIGTVKIVSSDPSEELYWGFTGSKPIWLSFSEVEGKTPADVDMVFNCILSGAEDDIDWKFIVVEKTKDGKWVDGYYRAFTLKGDIKNEVEQ